MKKTIASATAAITLAIFAAGAATPAFAAERPTPGVSKVSNARTSDQKDKGRAASEVAKKQSASVEAQIKTDPKNKTSRWVEAQTRTKGVPAGTAATLQIKVPGSDKFYDAATVNVDEKGYARFTGMSEKTSIPATGGDYQVQVSLATSPTLTSNVDTVKAPVIAPKATLSKPNVAVKGNGNSRYLTATVDASAPGTYMLQVNTKGSKGWKNVYSVTGSGTLVFDRNVAGVQVPTDGGKYNVRVVSTSGKPVNSPVAHITVGKPVPGQSTSLDPVTVYTDVDGNRYLQISGTASGYADGTTLNRVTVTTTNGGVLDHSESAVWLASGGQFVHGQWYFPVPTTSGGDFTVTATTGDGAAATSDVETVNVPAVAAPTQTLNPVTLYTAPDGNRYFQVSGTTTGYPAGAYDTTYIVTDSTGNRIKPNESAVYLNADGSFAHGQYWFPVPTTDGGKFTITSTIGTLAMKTTVSQTIDVAPVTAPTQTLNPSQVVTTWDGYNFVKVSGTTTGYPYNNDTWATAWLTDANGVQVGQASTVYLNADGTFAHGDWWFQVPAGTYTVHSTIGSAAMTTTSTDTVTVG